MGMTTITDMTMATGIIIERRVSRRRENCGPSSGAPTPMEIF